MYRNLMRIRTRREFCGTLAGAAAASAAAPKKIIVGAHAWVYAAPLPEYDFTPVLDRIFADLSWAGVDALELMDRALRHEDSVEHIGALSRKYRLPVLGTSYEGPMWNRDRHAAIFDDASAVIERVAKLGGRTFGVSVGDARRRKTEEELDAQAGLLKRLIGACAGHGIVLNLHNHIYEVRDDEHDLRGTLKRVPEAKLGPDLDWLVGAGLDPVDFIRRYGDRIVFAHLRDRRRDGTWPEALGEGAIDYAAIGRALRQAGFSGDLAIELAHPSGFKLTRPLRETWKVSREYVRTSMGY